MNKRFDPLKGKKIFVTGHTGFTGSWASIWLNQLGCDVFGYSLEPDTTPNLFTEAKVGNLVNGRIGDIRDFETLREEMFKFKPDLVLHLAAQPLVRRSYRIPRETFEINAQGTANVLEAAKGISSIKGVLCITTDKVYKNLETDHRYVETDELGGSDPYSTSKVAAELIIESYRRSSRNLGVELPVISVARGGNIIGGGDWSEDRLIPDFMRAFETKRALEIRFPKSTRPWQHVISLVEGYLLILLGMISKNSAAYDKAFNLGPLEEDSISVSQVLSELNGRLTGVEVIEQASGLHEAGKLGLDSSLAVKMFGWGPRWDTKSAIRLTAEWYTEYSSGKTEARNLCLRQIKEWSDGPIVELPS